MNEDYTYSPMCKCVTQAVFHESTKKDGVRDGACYNQPGASHGPADEKGNPTPCKCKKFEPK